MFGKKKEKSPEPSFQRDAEYTQSPEESERVINVENRPEKRATSAILSSDAEIEGTINFDGIMRIDGNVNGKISTENGELVVSESGIRDFQDIKRMQTEKIDAILIGETLMRSEDRAAALSILRGRQ